MRRFGWSRVETSLLNAMELRRDRRDGRRVARPVLSLKTNTEENKSHDGEKMTRQVDTKV